jgi:ubiquinone/menaquinone biosynthesis C-methylase UbiE
LDPATAIRLIVNGVGKPDVNQVWWDLGAGTGVFTQALSAILGNGNHVNAIDKDGASLVKIKAPENGATISKIEADFLRHSFTPRSADGILMANALHFVIDKQSFLMKLVEFLRITGRLIIIEYDTTKSNPWVPYPISFSHLQHLISQTGYSSILKLEEHPSLYNRANLYSALILR